MLRHEVQTPALILDLDILDENIATMADWARETGVALRPHAKSHKSSDIARRLIAAGAIGVSCATIAEAEAMAAAGLGGILLTSPMSAPDMLRRLGALLLRGADILVVADDPRNVVALAAIAGTAKRRLPIVVEIDVGVGRTGCIDIDHAVALAQQVSQERSLEFAGIQAYWGHLQQVSPFAKRKAKVTNCVARLQSLIAALRAANLAPSIVTGGGTGTHWLDAQHGVFTELQAGSYVFLDSCYSRVQVTPEGNPFSPSLFVSASVVTANRDSYVVVNAGYKAFATDSGKPVPTRGVAQGATYRFMGDEHGAVEFDPMQPRPELGSVIELMTSHCDPTVNLYARYAVARNDQIVDSWPILARGY